jgi:regulator of protease activity HflC (stomatin/prohibitin superfamily)
MKKESFLCVVVIFAILFLFSSAYTVEQGDRAVVLRFGQLESVTAPGFHLKFPFVDSVRRMTVRTRKIIFDTTSARKDMALVWTALSIYSKDVQAAQVILSVNFSIAPDKVADIYTKYGEDYITKVIVPQIQAKSKDSFGQYAAVEIIQAREKLTKRILDELQTHFAPGTGIIIESIQIENIDFSNEYERSVEERMKAEVEVAKVRQNFEREKVNADMVRTKAQGESDAKVMQAKANAESIRLLGEAEATAIALKQKALADNPRYVDLIQAEKWNGSLPQTMIPNGSLPIIGK